MILSEELYEALLVSNYDSLELYCSDNNSACICESIVGESYRSKARII